MGLGEGGCKERVDQKRYWTRMLCSSIPRKKFLKTLHTHGSTRIRLRGHQAPEHLWLSVWPQPRLPKRAKSWRRRAPEAAVSKDRQRVSPARSPAHRGVTSRGGGGRAEAARTHPSSVSRVGHNNLASVAVESATADWDKSGGLGAGAGAGAGEGERRT